VHGGCQQEADLATLGRMQVFRARRPGDRFSFLYLQAGDPATDSGRARHRVGALFGDAAFNAHGQHLAAYLGRNLGVPLAGNGQNQSHWHQFIRECRTADFLDAVTVVYRYLFWHADEIAANWWRDAVRQIFHEENLTYELDDAGGVHPRVDREFQRNVVSAVVGLEAERYKKIRELIDLSSINLSADPPNYKQAWRATFSAIEVLFGRMFPYARLTPDEIRRRLRPLIERAYEGDVTAQKAAHRMLAGFEQWVESSHHYRHHPGAEETPDPPADIAILSISYGASVLRWLVGLDEAREHPMPDESANEKPMRARAEL